MFSGWKNIASTTSQLESGSGFAGCQQLRFKDSYKRDFLSAHVNIYTWEDIAADIDSAETDKREQQTLMHQQRRYLGI